MKIIINGKTHDTFEGNEATYEHIVQVAGMTGNPSMTVSWRDERDARVQSGCILSAGQSIELRDGMRISVCHTGNA